MQIANPILFVSIADWHFDIHNEKHIFISDQINYSSNSKFNKFAGYDFADVRNVQIKKFVDQVREKSMGKIKRKIEVT